MSNDIVVICPHCNQNVLIEKLNCKIFRHGILKLNNNQIDPHSSKELCDNLIENELIFGCGKPFKIIRNNYEFIAIVCDYI
jgi:hypothetical protein